MKSEAGFNPIECERGKVDFEIGRKCFEASQKALPKLKEIAADYPEVQRMVSEIEFGIKREGEQKQKGDDFGKFFSQQAGPGGCKNEEGCFAYCNDPAHGAECISFGAKHQVFQGDEAVGRYQKYNNIITSPSPSNYNQTGQISPYPAGDNRGTYANTGNFGGPGPSPECFAAIQSGDFVKAKEICSVPTNPYQYQPPQPPYQINPNYQQSSNSSYPSYDEKEKCYRNGGFWTGNYCDYQNRSASSYSSYSYPSSAYSSFSYTPPSGQKEQICNSYGLRSWIRTDASLAKIENLKQVCASVTSSGGNIWMTGAGDYNSQDFGMPDEAKCRSWTSSSSSYSSYSYSSYPCSAYSSYAYSSYPSSAYSSYSYSSYPSSTYSSYSYSSYPSYSSCASEMISLLGTGCHFMYNDSSGNRVYCNGEMTKSAKYGDTAAKDGCQSGSYSSYSYSSYPSSAYSSYTYVPPSGQKEQVWNSYGLRSWIRTDASSARIENLKQVCG